METIKPLVDHLSTHPEHLISGSDDLKNIALNAAKSLYDAALKDVNYAQLDELHTTGFDNDQIWEMIQLQNKPILKIAESILLRIESNGNGKKEKEHVNGSESSQISDRAKDNDDGMSESDSHDSEDAVTDENNYGKNENVAKKEKKKVKFVDHDDEELDDDSENEEDIDYTKDPDELYGGEDDIDPSSIMYADFFGDEKPSKKRKRNSHIQSNDRQDDKEEDLDEDDEDNDEDEDEDEENAIIKRMNNDLFAEDENAEVDPLDKKSTHEKQVDKLRRQIAELEAENVADKDWTLMGEASAKARPLNSLLEEDLEFEHAAKVAPIVTDETTQSLEEMIKSRIVNDLFDDVERKREVERRPFVPSSQIELNDEKSQKSLAQIYEDEYIGTSNEKDLALSKAHKEIEILWSGLCSKLDALSNFHYTPKEPKASINVVSNLPTIAMEEALPVAVSSSQRLAPEEVYEKSSVEVKARTEMSAQERLKQRKLRKRERKKRHERINKIITPNNGVKNEKEKALKSLIGQQNVSIITKDGSRIGNDTQTKPTLNISKALKL